MNQKGEVETSDVRVIFHKIREKRQCQICNNYFDAATRFTRFCDNCKMTDRYKYAEWLPDALSLQV